MTTLVLLLVAQGALFTTLETAHIGLQALDTTTTLWAVHQGLVEANPVLRGLTAQPVAFVAVKAGVTGMTVLLTRKLAKRNRLAALVLLAGLNSVYGFVVTRNVVVMRRAREPTQQ